MGYWGWRPLLICVVVSVWVSGCNIVTDASPGVSPSLTPQVTLTVRQLATVTVPPTPASSASLPTVSRPPGTQSTPSGHAASRPNFAVRPPDCYPNPTGGLLCLGKLTNPFNYPLEGVVLRAEAIQADGSIFVSREIAVEQTIIPAGGSAPYSILFDNQTNVTSVVATVTQMEAAHPAQDPTAQIDIRNESGRMVDGRYVVAATLYNLGETTLQSLRVFVTLEDAAGRLVGYRVTQISDDLAAGTSLPLRIELVPQGESTVSRHTLYIEAHERDD